MLRPPPGFALWSQAVDDQHPPLALTRRIIASVIVIALALVGALQGFKAFKAMRRDSARVDGDALAPLVRTQVAVKADYPETLRGFGRSRALRRATVVAEVTGVVRAVSPLLEAGTVVPASEGADLPVLVTIDNRDLADKLDRAKAEVLAAEGELTRLGTLRGSLRTRLLVTIRELEAAQRELERIEPLVPKTLTRSDLDAQRLQVGLRERAKLVLDAQIQENADAAVVAESRIAALRSGVALAVREKARTQISAPFAGRIEERMVEIGERVKPGDPLFTIVDLSRVEIPIALPAGRYDEVLVGATASLRLPERTKPLWTGTVARVAPQIQASQRTFFAYVVVEGTPGQNPAPPGGHLIAEVEGRTHLGVIAIPRRAFLRERVFVAVPQEGKDIAIVEIRIPTVERYLSGVALVSDGLAAGEHFLVTNLESVAEGSTVRMAPEAP